MIISLYHIKMTIVKLNPTETDPGLTWANREAKINLNQISMCKNKPNKIKISYHRFNNFHKQQQCYKINKVQQRKDVTSSAILRTSNNNSKKKGNVS